MVAARSKLRQAAPQGHRPQQLQQQKRLFLLITRARRRGPNYPWQAERLGRTRGCLARPCHSRRNLSGGNARPRSLLHLPALGKKPPGETQYGLAPFGAEGFDPPPPASPPRPEHSLLPLSGCTSSPVAPIQSRPTTELARASPPYLPRRRRDPCAQASGFRTWQAASLRWLSTRPGHRTCPHPSSPAPRTPGQAVRRPVQNGAAARRLRNHPLSGPLQKPMSPCHCVTLAITI